MRHQLTMAALAVALCGCRFDPQGLSTSDCGASGTDQRSSNGDRALEHGLTDLPGAGEGGAPDGIPFDQRLSDQRQVDRSPGTPDQSWSCPVGEVPCPSGCANLASDPKNCGQCGKVCTADETCQASCVAKSACASGSNAQVFTNGMRGCKGKVTFDKRASLCSSGAKVCSAKEWLDRRGTTAPSHDYWTNDFLYAYKSTSDYSGHCRVTTNKPLSSWCTGQRPMRVCVSVQPDPEGNTCNWINCGYENTTSAYFGGCETDPTAGTLCCLW